MQAVPAAPVPHSDPEGLAEGGYGLHIIRSFMSEVSYYQDGDRNVLRMTKKFHPQALGLT
jgi:anti-sigma regulatory factor (Ser/Thr protein kinase)